MKPQIAGQTSVQLSGDPSVEVSPTQNIIISPPPDTDERALPWRVRGCYS